jgi:hypothetical protein
MDNDKFELDNEICTDTDAAEGDVTSQALMGDIADADWSRKPMEPSTGLLAPIELTDDQNKPVGPNNKLEGPKPNKVEDRNSIEPNSTKDRKRGDLSRSEGSEPPKADDVPSPDKPNNVAYDGGANSVNGGEYKNPEADLRPEQDQKLQGGSINNNVEATPVRKPKEPIPTDLSGYGELKKYEDIVPDDGAPTPASGTPDVDLREEKKKKSDDTVTV